MLAKKTPEFFDKIKAGEFTLNHWQENVILGALESKVGGPLTSEPYSNDLRKVVGNCPNLETPLASYRIGFGPEA